MIASHVPPTGDLACNPGSPTWNQTGDPLVLRPALSPLSHTSRGSAVCYYNDFPIIGVVQMNDDGCYFRFIPSVDHCICIFSFEVLSFTKLHLTGVIHFCQPSQLHFPIMCQIPFHSLCLYKSCFPLLFPITIFA